MGAAMDSNDFRGNELIGRAFTVLGKALRQSPERCYTCAEDSDFKGVGDFIFDSDERTPIPYMPELPCGWNAHTQLMSDHLPLVAYVRVGAPATTMSQSQ